jgi:tripartite-type tricarboxylate transporter receptor subunit TctC
MKGAGTVAAIALTALVAFGAPASGLDQYPVRAVTLIVPLAPGTTADFLARLFAERLTRRFGQQFVVSNRPGAGGLIAAQAGRLDEGRTTPPPAGARRELVEAMHAVAATGFAPADQTPSTGCSIKWKATQD